MINRVGYEFNPHAWALTNKKRKLKKRNIVAEVFTDYCSHTSLHGIGYLGAKNKTLLEKIWWTAIFTTSLTVCIYLITDTWLKWKQNPVILSFEKEQTPIGAIPFPAVTICPVNKVRQTVYNYTDVFRKRHNLTKEEYKQFWDISLVCFLEQYDEIFESTVDFTDEEAIRNIFNVAPRISNTIFSAKWQSTRDATLFSEQLNKEGLCFSSNSLIMDDKFTTKTGSIYHDTKSTKWTLDDGYSPDSKLNVYPRRTAQNGADYGLSFIVYSFTSDIDHVCGYPISGYKIILHNPVETARAAKQYFLITSDIKATIMIKPELTKTSKSLRSVSAYERKCYFSNEKPLRFFTVYTQNNCRLECDANITEHYCGCVPFYMSRDTNSLICGFGKMKCLKKIGRIIMNFQMMERGINMSKPEIEKAVYKIYDNCDCLAACNNLQFTAEISSAKSELFKSLGASGSYDGRITQRQTEELKAGNVRVSAVDIFFKDAEFLALQRRELYGTTNFLANCGGLLGLFLGFSFLSLVEIIYFLTIRIWCKISSKY